MNRLRSLWHTLYTAWCVLWFVLPFFVLYPFLLLFSSITPTRPLAHFLHRLWAKTALLFFMLPKQVIGLQYLKKNQRYVFCPNHSSYIDIVLLMDSLPGFLNFVGKSSLARVPLWGLIYKNLYICVNRSSRVSRARTYAMSVASLQQGRSVTIFPEGKIDNELAGHRLAPFHNGAFKLAIEAQVPVVPVTMPFNHFFLPDNEKQLKVRWHPLKIIFHEPIPTIGMTTEETETLKDTVYTIIQAELDRQHIHENNHRNLAHAGASGPAGV